MKSFMNHVYYFGISLLLERKKVLKYTFVFILKMIYVEEEEFVFRFLTFHFDISNLLHYSLYGYKYKNLI